MISRKAFEALQFITQSDLNLNVDKHVVKASCLNDRLYSEYVNDSWVPPNVYKCSGLTDVCVNINVDLWMSYALPASYGQLFAGFWLLNAEKRFMGDTVTD